MASVFVGYEETDITDEKTVYTCNTLQAVVIGLSVANASDTDTEVKVKKNNAYLVKNAPVNTKSALVVAGGEQKIILEKDDTISVSSEDNVDCIISLLEIS